MFNQHIKWHNNNNTIIIIILHDNLFRAGLMTSDGSYVVFARYKGWR